MTVQPVRGGAHLVHEHGGPLSKLAFWMAALTLAVVVLAAAIFAVAYAVGGQDATSDNWVGIIAVMGLIGGLMASSFEFAVAVVAWFRHERGRLLWLPLFLFPALLAFVVLGEAYWWE